MERVLVVPAAGAASRLGATVPKLLVTVNGRTMIERLFALYAAHAQHAVVVVSPGALRQVADLPGRAPMPISFVVQETPTGMLDAVLLAGSEVEAVRPRRVLVTWCDQVAVLPETIARVAAAASREPAPDLVMPTCRMPAPYVHLVRGGDGRIVGVLHRREGDVMPAAGESDAGVFDLSFEAFHAWLPEYARQPAIGARTGERNFVPFAAFASRRGRVATVACVEAQEAIGINTPAELAMLESHLRARNPV